MLRLLLLLSLLWAVEGACAEGLRRVPCDDPRLPQGPSPQGPEHSVDVPESVTVQEGANTAHDSPVATNNPYWTGREETQALTHTPDILVPGTLESCCPSNLTCSVPWACEQGTPPTFSWNSAALTSLGPGTNHSSVLTLTLWPQDHGTNLTCQVKFPAAGVTTQRTIQLNVTYAAENPAVSVSPGAGPGSGGPCWGWGNRASSVQDRAGSPSCWTNLPHHCLEHLSPPSWAAWDSSTCPSPPWGQGDTLTAELGSQAPSQPPPGPASSLLFLFPNSFDLSACGRRHSPGHTQNTHSRLSPEPRSLPEVISVHESCAEPWIVHLRTERSLHVSSTQGPCSWWCPTALMDPVLWAASTTGRPGSESIQPTGVGSGWS
ncbi:Hypothetical predicted protein [Marmota monax]|uniref:Ig-like domain-containing protein n=1 Tax=Marmota monax TaxID=9995 RepID=A0A5E4BY62_MARMO|nr:Hypothetical predicted protein [Marmota monax]